MRNVILFLLIFVCSVIVLAACNVVHVLIGSILSLLIVGLSGFGLVMELLEGERE